MLCPRLDDRIHRVVIERENVSGGRERQPGLVARLVDAPGVLSCRHAVHVDFTARRLQGGEIWQTDVQIRLQLLVEDAFVAACDAQG